jgi:hypothetical protein
VTANRILAHQGVLDGYGHISARCEDDSNLYYIGDASPPGNVRAKNVFRWDLNNDPAGHKQRAYGERFIHGQIYLARPDVHAVVHCHGPRRCPDLSRRRARLGLSREDRYAAYVTSSNCTAWCPCSLPELGPVNTPEVGGTSS